MPDSPFGVPENLSPFGDDETITSHPTKYVPPRGYTLSRKASGEHPAATDPTTSTAPPTPPIATQTDAPLPSPPATAPPIAVESAPPAPPSPQVHVPPPTQRIAPPAGVVGPPPVDQYTRPFATTDRGTAFDEDAPVPKSRLGRRTLAAGLGITLAGGLVFGGWYAYGIVSGGGTQPADVITADAAAIIRLDLDPSLSQKVNLARLVGNEVDDQKIATNDDLPSLVADALKLKECGLSYDTDIRPWIGQRFAMAAVPGKDTTLTPLVAIQVTDEKKASATFATLNDCEALEGSSSLVGSGYAIVTESGPAATTAEKVLTGEAPALSANTNYNAATEASGDQGFASFWVDPAPVAKALEQGLPAPGTIEPTLGGTDTDVTPVSNPSNPTGRNATAPAAVTPNPLSAEDLVSVTGVLRATGSGLELPLTARFKPGKAPSPLKPATRIGDVPADAQWAFAAGEFSTEALDQVTPGLLGVFSANASGPAPSEVEQGISVLKAIFGTEGVAVAGGGFTNTGSNGGEWVALLTKVTQKEVTVALKKQTLIPSSEVHVAATKTGTVLSDSAKTSQRFNTTGRLSSSAEFRDSVGNWSGSPFIGFAHVSTFDKTSRVTAVGLNVANPIGDYQTAIVKVTLK